MTIDKLKRLEGLLKCIGRDAEQSQDYENGDSIGHTVAVALELLGDIELEEQPACEEIPRGVCEPLAA